jgi:high-affinity nickel permease
MQITLLSFGIFFLAILLGIKHSLDADHLVAVSALLTRTGNTMQAVKLSISWSLGHMVTATILTIILFTFKDTLFLAIFNNAEILVPLMLIFIGVVALAFEFNIIHFHKHTHSNEDGSIQKDHTHLHAHNSKSEHGAMMGIGFIHGIASNDELLLLFTLTFGANSLEEILLSVGVFTIGVIFGMVAYSYSLNWSVNKFESRNVMKTVNVMIALLSIGYAFWLLYGLEGLNVIESLGVKF